MLGVGWMVFVLGVLGVSGVGDGWERRDGLAAIRRAKECVSATC